MHREVLRLRGIAIPTKYDTDHINRNRLDNRTANLRVVPHWLNCQNGSNHRDSTSSYRGVSFYKRDGTWSAQLCVRGEYHWLGRYRTPEEASAVYEAARERLGLTPP